MGMGFGIVLPEADAKRALSLYGAGAKIVGRIEAGSGVPAPYAGSSGTISIERTEP